MKDKKKVISELKYALEKCGNKDYLLCQCYLRDMIYMDTLINLGSREICKNVMQKNVFSSGYFYT